MSSSGRRRPPQQTLSAAGVRLMVALLAIIVLIGAVGAWRLKTSTTLPPALGLTDGATDNPCYQPSRVNITATPRLTPTVNPCAEGSGTSNPIIAENRLPGTNSWLPTQPVGPTTAIAAFTAPVSVNLGQSIKLYVSTTAPTYTYSVYRVGWYQGYGARLVYTSPVISGIRQPASTIDPVTHMVSCANWTDPVTLAIPSTWVSGVYMAKFTSSKKYIRYAVFVVRNDASHSSSLLQIALATYQAYNEFGGHSLYGAAGKYAYNGVGRSYAVSFDRPLAGNGLGLLPRYEGPLIMFLERAGYDVSYMADIDLTLHPQPITQHKLLIIGGHDEYWSASMRKVATAARDHGVSLAFFSSNSVYWQTRLASSPLGPDRVIICYKDATKDPLSASKPSETTIQWASDPVNQPQSTLLGEIYNGIPTQPAPLVIASGATPYLVGTGLKPGSELPGLVFGEIDSALSDYAHPSNVTILAASPVHMKSGATLITRVSNATLYTAPSGAMVFDTGTFEWYSGLGVRWPVAPTTTPTATPAAESGETQMTVPLSSGTQQLTVNILNAMIVASSVSTSAKSATPQT